jgi:7,8-didemethyl-8-hydroxy-5-deazariboflavin synthase CofH subunit
MRLLDRIVAGYSPSWRDLAPLGDATGRELHELCAVADELRRRQAGDLVTYVVNRNINFTNVCIKRCGFCAFARGVRSEQGYFLPIDEVVARAVEAEQLGATEVCVQAGLAPNLDGGFYLDLVRALHRAVPRLHLHALSPEEIKHGARRSRLDVRDYLTALREAGLGSLPGTSAEILDDAVRDRIAPGRITTGEWLHVVRTAHAVGLPTTSTMMFGHVETIADRLRHMELLRDVQRDTGGFTEFVPLSFVHAEAPMFVTHGPGAIDVIRTHALARLMLGADLPNLQVSWVKEGLRAAEHLLACGVNDLGGTLINESISTSAGAGHGQLATPAELRRVARAAGRAPAERTTLYQLRRRFAHGADDLGDPLDSAAAADFGSYAALTRDPRHRWQQVVQVGRPVEVEREPVAVERADTQAAGAGAGEVVVVAVGPAEAGGDRARDPDREGVGPQVVAIRRHDQVGAVERVDEATDVAVAE